MTAPPTEVFTCILQIDSAFYHSTNDKHHWKKVGISCLTTLGNITNCIHAG